MTTTLRAVLTAFEQSEAPLSLAQLAADLSVPPAMLEGMIDFWVRKGRLQETSTAASACAGCRHGKSCPLVIKMPRRYELVTGEAQPAQAPPCAGCRCGVVQAKRRA